MIRVLEHVPASVKIVRHVEKRMICGECDTTAAGEIPILPIERGNPGRDYSPHSQIRRSHFHLSRAEVARLCVKDAERPDDRPSIKLHWGTRVEAEVRMTHNGRIGGEPLICHQIRNNQKLSCVNNMGADGVSSGTSR